MIFEDLCATHKGLIPTFKKLELTLPTTRNSHQYLNHVFI